MIASNNYEICVDMAGKNGLAMSICKNGYNSFLKHGFFIGDDTIWEEMKRLTAGKYIIFQNSNCEVKRYHLFDNRPVKRTEMEYIDQLEMLFSKAISRTLKKSEDLNCTIEADLSGGLDSRMINFMLHKLNSQNVTNVCYSMKGSLDEQIARKISSELNTSFIFEDLKMGEFIFDMDEITKKAEGQHFFTASAGSNSVFKKLDSKIGISMMGLFGEVLKGQTGTSVYKRLNSNNVMGNVYNHSFRWDIPSCYLDEFQNEEIFNLYNYGFKFILSSALVRMDRVEIMPVFMDVDFLEFCLSIPIEERKDYTIYKKWIHVHHREAERYLWQASMSRLDKKKDIEYYTVRIKYLYERLYNKCMKLFHRERFCVPFISEMNPFKFWIKNNESLALFIEKYLEENLNYIPDAYMQMQMEELYRIGDEIDRLVLINILSIFKQYTYGEMLNL